MDVPDKVLTPVENDNSQTPNGTEEEITSQETTPDLEETPKPEVDYKVKFSESTRENDRIRKENEEIKKKLDEIESKLAQANAIPSEDSLSMKYPEWDMMTESEKVLYRKMETLEQEKNWEKDFARMQKKFPVIADREDEFRDYCKKYPKNIDAETLIKSFLFEDVDTKPKRKGLETPTQGPKDVSTGEITWADVKRIRESDEKLYQKMIVEGRIDPRKIKK